MITNSMKPENILKDKSHMEKYKDKTFTEKGYKTLLKYTENLIIEYFKRDKAENYPFTLGVSIFGIPTFGWSSEFKDRDDLHSRIKAYCQLLGTPGIIVKVGESEFKFELKTKGDNEDG